MITLDTIKSPGGSSLGASELGRKKSNQVVVVKEMAGGAGKRFA